TTFFYSGRDSTSLALAVLSGDVESIQLLAQEAEGAVDSSSLLRLARDVHGEDAAPVCAAIGAV
ncbi:MAG: hypothetical protein SGPRY_012231, partial [Prymnesium sp.]